MPKRSPNRVSETDVARAVMRVLEHEPDGEAAIGTIVRKLPDYLMLSDEDRADSPTRKGEAIWEQQVRNITSHKDASGNLIHDGYLAVVKGGLKLTDSGKRKLTR
jgi:hypothetical protein